LLSRSRALLPCFTENVEQLRDNIKEVAAAEEALQQRAGDERLRIDEMRAELEKLTAQETRLPPEAERLNQQMAQQRSLVVQREAGCETSLASKEQKLAELDRGCALYRTRLGLAFERVGDERLRLTFTNIDPYASATATPACVFPLCYSLSVCAQRLF
jgi:chromosome segregation ATPase